MAKDIVVEFKTLLTKEEYNSILEKYKNYSGNLQVNYYFDTKRFTLKASDAMLRVKERDGLTLTLERKKGYTLQRIDEPITKEQFNTLIDTGKIPVEKIANDLMDIIKDQNVINFMSFSTYRVSFPYKKGKISLDKCEYVGVVDYELEYEATNREVGKLEFINLIKDFNINYKKSQVKLKRAYDALRKTL